MDAAEYTGPVSAMIDSDWLSAKQLEDPDGDGYLTATVTIEKVMELHDVEFEQGRKKKKCYALKFSGKDRMLILNATNRDTLTAAYGRRAKHWLGRKVTIYVQTGIKLGRKVVPGIRLKPVPTE